MKKNVLMRLASCLMVAVLLTTCAISGTFAKYTSSATGSDSARVAKWSVTVNGTDIASSTPQTVDIELFKTVNDTKDGNAETDINTDEQLIAPGTTGEFEIAVKNESEVNAEYSLTLTATKSDATLPIEYSVDNGANWTDDLSTLSVDTTALAMGATATTTVQWRWEFDGNDTVDTDLGVDGTATVTVNAAITATQVD